jgi:hypothetical protein
MGHVSRLPSSVSGYRHSCILYCVSVTYINPLFRVLLAIIIHSLSVTMDGLLATSKNSLLITSQRSIAGSWPKSVPILS